MGIRKDYKKLCTPASLYFTISVLALIISMFENQGNQNKYKVGSYSFKVASLAIVFIFQSIYILFWTWILNLICKDGHKSIAWFLVLIPFILLFILLGTLFVIDNTVEGIENMKEEDKKKTDEDHKKASVAHTLKEQLDQTKKMLDECRKNKKDDDKKKV